MSKEIHTDLAPEERYGFAYDIDQWYPKCRDFTFPTEFLPISQEEAKVMIKQYEINVLHQKVQLNEEEYEIYKQLEQKIEEILQTHFYDEEEDIVAAFVRMSSRSPKDAAFSSENMKQLLSKKLYEKKAAFRKTKSTSQVLVQNYEFIAFFEAQLETLKFESAQQVLELHCTSRRVYDDLKTALQYKSDENNKNENLRWNTQMVFRKWSENHDIMLEFRGFVYNRKLTAISQYFDPLYFEKLNKNKNVYLKAMQSFYDSVKDQIPFDNCIIDFLITEPESDEEEDEEQEDEEEEEQEEEEQDQEGEDKESDEEEEDNNEKINPDNQKEFLDLGEETKIVKEHPLTEQEENELLSKLKVQVIEFNPFNRFTGAALYTWLEDLDLFRGEREFEFRIRTEPISLLRNTIQAQKENDEEKVSEAKTMMLLNLMEVDSSVLDEYSDLLEMVDTFMSDDVERINSNLRYVLAKTSKESFLNYFQTTNQTDESDRI